MLFNSLSFLVYFPIVVAIYFTLPHRFRWIHLLVASCLFYVAFVPAYILILLGTIAIDYVAGLAIESAVGIPRQLVLAISIVANVGVLAAFKYWNFLGDNFSALARALHWNYSIAALRIVLPIGLSFHTFQAMSYTIEVYRGKQKAERHLGIYALYVMFFPQLVAGPIERPQNLLHQFYVPHRFEYERVVRGLRLMYWGYFKKLVIADRMSSVADAVFSHPHAFHGAHLLLATYCFSLQIYCDFSGYSDIALGTAKVLGFKLMTNFDRPYLAVSVAEFWRRWHISLSTWFKDYLYIPLGGSRAGRFRHGFNLIIVFLISGLWHGAAWTFAIWGLLHGLYMIAHLLLDPVRSRLRDMFSIDRNSRPVRVIRMLITFNLVALAWIFFRANNAEDAFWIIGRLATDLVHPQAALDGWKNPPVGPWGDALKVKNLNFVFLLVLLAGLLQVFRKAPQATELLDKAPTWARWTTYYVLAMLILWLGDLGAKNFIYFQF